MKKVQVDVKYRLGHTYTHEYAETEYHCPNCGEKTVWEETDGGDYYEGPTLLCKSCSYFFTMPALGNALADHWDGTFKQVLDEINKVTAVDEKDLK